MRNKFMGIAVFMLAAATLACTALQPRSEPGTGPTQAGIPLQGNLPLTEDEVPRISLEQARAAIDSGAAVVVDVRSSAAYAEAHAVGAVSIPLDEFENNIDRIPLEKDRWIITYCT